MKKSKLLGVLLCSTCLAVSGTAMPAMADGMKVVTLGADLTDSQKNTMMKYFNVDSSQVQILTITNQDEREHLSAYVPLEQIGTRTVSCAYVKPTQSGGIKVRTANLNWVTCNMIATSLSTSGVKNCEVVAACPFEVSGTGALTGIQMAYETATGEKLDDTKKQIATEEMVVTGNLADDIGKNDATTVINKAKMQVIADNVQNADDIYNIVVNIADQNNVGLSSDQIDEIVGLLQQIAQQNYNYDDVKETLERVDDNTSGDGEIGNVDAEDDAAADADEDDILNSVDDSALGDDVIASSTQDPTLEEETGMDSDMTQTDVPEETGDEIIDDSVYTEEEQSDSVDGQQEDVLDTSMLTEDQLSMYNKFDTFCKGEYEGDQASLQTAMEDPDAVVSVVMDAEPAATLTKTVEKIYLDILTQGTDSYVPDGTEIYMTTELNMLNKSLKDIFGLNPGVQADPSLIDQTDEMRQTLYSDTMKFFEKLYGETVQTSETDAAEETEAAEDGYVEETAE